MRQDVCLIFHGIQNVRIEHIRGKLNDHYDPRDNVIRLSDGVYGSCSVAAIGIACHEAGHAAQHAEKLYSDKGFAMRFLCRAK